MDAAMMTKDPIDPAVVLAAVEDDGRGAATLFVGTVRNHHEGRAVRGMRYDAYDAMATDVLREIVAEAEAALGDGRVVAVHRTGELAVGDISVVIAAASAHRAPTFDATRYVIEQIKLRLPVWKQEHYVNGDAEWLPGAIPPVPPGSAAPARAPDDRVSHLDASPAASTS